MKTEKEEYQEPINQQKSELLKRIEKMPKYDLSKSGIDEEFYLKREEIIKLINEI